MIWTLTQVAVGGALGSLARFATTLGAASLLGTAFPYGTAVSYGTVLVNIAGSFAMGALVVAMIDRGPMHHAPFALAGILGRFTSFSAFSLDAFTVWERDGLGLAALYVLGTIGALGMMTMRGAGA